jgi:hypothetical protein
VSRAVAKLSDHVLERLAAGESLRVICRDPGMPSERAVRIWVAEDREGFAARYRAAREVSAEHWDNEAERVLREAPPDRDEIARARELASHYRWRASKLAPREYGDRIDVNHTGTVTIAAQLSEVRQRRALLEAEPVAIAQPADVETEVPG